MYNTTKMLIFKGPFDSICENKKGMKSNKEEKGSGNCYFFELFDSIMKWNHIIYDSLSNCLVK